MSIVHCDPFIRAIRRNAPVVISRRLDFSEDDDWYALVEELAMPDGSKSIRRTERAARDVDGELVYEPGVEP